MSKRIVLDTNIFVAAGFRPESYSGRTIQAVRDGAFCIAWHESTRAETRKVLEKIPPLSWKSFAKLFKPENEYCEALDEQGFAHVPDRSDRKFAALAKVMSAPLVTQDEHLLDTRSQSEITIVTPNEFWNGRRDLSKL